MKTSAEKIASRGRKIEALEFDNDRNAVVSTEVVTPIERALAKNG
jgi:hypothetical protein